MNLTVWMSNLILLWIINKWFILQLAWFLTYETNQKLVLVVFLFFKSHKILLLTYFLTFCSSCNRTHSWYKLHPSQLMEIRLSHWRLVFPQICLASFSDGCVHILQGQQNIVNTPTTHPRWQYSIAQGSPSTNIFWLTLTSESNP